MGRTHDGHGGYTKGTLFGEDIGNICEGGECTSKRLKGSRSSNRYDAAHALTHVILLEIREQLYYVSIHYHIKLPYYIDTSSSQHGKHINKYRSI